MRRLPSLPLPPAISPSFVPESSAGGSSKLRLLLVLRCMPKPIVFAPGGSPSPLPWPPPSAVLSIGGCLSPNAARLNMGGRPPPKLDGGEMAELASSWSSSSPTSDGVRVGGSSSSREESPLPTEREESRKRTETNDSLSVVSGGGGSYFGATCPMSEAIRGFQSPSEAIRGHQRPSEAIRGHQRYGWSHLNAFRGHGADSADLHDRAAVGVIARVIGR